MKKLENLNWSPKWVSQLGCLKGCLDYLGVDVSDAWLFGGTGYAFVLNVHEEVCPSGPTAWNTEMVNRLANHMGVEIHGVFGMKANRDFAEKQRLAWEHTQQAIDQGWPCYGWELDIPEFYVISGYDDEGYYFSGPGCQGVKGPKRWQELGDTGIGIVELYSVEPGQAVGEVQTVKAALSFALEHATNPANWIFAQYKSGLPGYDQWMRALESGTAGAMGMAYNAAVWSECRGYAVSFLQEAQERIGDQASGSFDAAIALYQRVFDSLKIVADAFPFQSMEPGHVKDETRVRTAVEALKTARDAEADGLTALQRIVDEL